MSIKIYRIKCSKNNFTLLKFHDVKLTLKIEISKKNPKHQDES